MSIRQGNNIIASSGVNNLSLLDIKWSDHKIDDLNWILSSDEWYSGTSYKKIYKHLINDWETGTTGILETIAGYTIYYCLSPDGHKLVDYNQESTVQQIYNATGVAWYYILDGDNKRFKLPRTKHTFTGLRHGVGSYVEAGLPNITGTFSDGLLTTTSSSSSTNPDDIAASGAFDGSHVVDRTAYPGNSSGWFVNGGINFDASRSSSIYGNSTTVQPPATEMYLYFYADQFTDGSSGKNLTDSTKNIAKWSTNVTNCITEIPQDIKLELSDGTLTLKAGSKVYIPNGFESDGTTPNFDVVIIESDISPASPWTFNATGVLYLNTTDNFIRLMANGRIYSGPTEPTIPSGSPSNLWYDTSSNKIKFTFDTGSTWSEKASFPIAIVTWTYADNVNTFTSIDQVFNGFGYIGSTAFALPGLKVLAPNGRNEDGSLNNISISIDSVQTRTIASSVTTTYDTHLLVSDSGSIVARVCEYDQKTNEIIFSNPFSGKAAIIANIATVSGAITRFIPKNTFQSLDWNDKWTIASWGMPSSKNVNLTLGASGNSYIALGTGYFILAKRSSAANQSISGLNGSYQVASFAVASNNALMIQIPAKKGDTVYIYYSAAGETDKFRFVYAEGEL